MKNQNSSYGKISWGDLDVKGGAAQETIDLLKPNPVAASGYTVSVTLNSNPSGSWFDRSGYISRYGPTYSAAVFSAETIIHELGHVFEDLFGSNTTKIEDDSKSDGISQENTDRVMTSCFGWQKK